VASPSDADPIRRFGLAGVHNLTFTVVGLGCTYATFDFSITVALTVLGGYSAGGSSLLALLYSTTTAECRSLVHSNDECYLGKVKLDISVAYSRFTSRQKPNRQPDYCEPEKAEPNVQRRHTLVSSESLLRISQPIFYRHNAHSMTAHCVFKPDRRSYQS
jgi:hypothetical protein